MGPFFSFYGGKWRNAPRHYSPPYFDTIVEPFAGSAGYSVRHPNRMVVLCDIDPVIAGLWEYLINVSADEILSIPDVPQGGTVADMGLCQEASWLVGFWLNRGGASPKKTPSKWMRSGVRPGSFWGERVRKAIAGQVGFIRHWQVFNCGYEDLSIDGPATWFVDPPYWGAGTHYRHSSKSLDFNALGKWCRSLDGQVIVCENDGANWLPFRPLSSVKTTRKGKRSIESVWTNG